jgi:mevalonate pyrophosphate decarboxylase
MDIGMLWFDNDPKSDLKSKVTRAADYYRHKYGQEPNLCLVNPNMIPEKETKSGSIAVCSNSAILPNHFWIGVQQQVPS